MDARLMKSEEQFSFHIEGEQTIDAVLLSNIIGNIAELTKMAALAEEPEAYLKMNVTAFKNGSFQINFSAICEVAANLINTAPEILTLASTTVSTLKGFFEIKKLLKGKQAKSIVPAENGKICVTSEDGDSIVVNESCEAVINNIKIDTLVVNVASDIKENNKNGGFSFDTRNESTNFTSNDVTEIRKPIATETEVTLKKNLIKVDLLIKKPTCLVGRYGRLDIMVNL